MKRKVKWDEYVEVPVVNFRYLVIRGRISSFARTYIGGAFERYVRPLLNDERGTNLRRK